jgi:hypothetical protein
MSIYQIQIRGWELLVRSSVITTRTEFLRPDETAKLEAQLLGITGSI